MKKVVSFILCFCLLACVTQNAAMAASVLDLSEIAIPTSIQTQAKQALADYNAGKILTSRFFLAKSINTANLSQLTPNELATLEKAKLPDDATAKLVAAHKKSVLAGIKTVKNGDRVALKNSSTLESFSYSYNQRNDAFRIKLGKTTFDLHSTGGPLKAQLITIDQKSAQKALFIEVTSESDIKDVYCLRYVNGKLQRTAFPGSLAEIRCAGNLTFYIVNTSPPFYSVNKYTLQNNGKLIKGAMRTIPYVLPVTFAPSANFSTAPFTSLKIKTLEGKTKTYAKNAQFCVISFIPHKAYTQGENAYVILLDKDNEVIIIRAFDYMLYGVDDPLNTFGGPAGFAYFAGFTFLS